MKHRILILILALSLTITACSTSGSPASATPEAIPTVIAENTIIVEGNLEPVRFAEIAFNASGVVSEVLVQEGQTVKQGDVLVRLGNSESPKPKWRVPKRL